MIEFIAEKENKPTNKQPQKKKKARESKKPKRKVFLSLLFRQVWKSYAECPSGLTISYK